MAETTAMLNRSDRVNAANSGLKVPTLGMGEKCCKFILKVIIIINEATYHS